jgi:hypothetical protein
MDVNIDLNKEKHNIDYVLLQKMGFLYNALEDGWCIKKRNDKYIFYKNHNNQKEIYLDDYLKKFLVKNFDINKIIN